MQNFTSYSAFVSQAVRGARNILGLSQVQLAEYSGVSRPTLARLEAAKDMDLSPRTKTIQKLLTAFYRLGVEVVIDSDGFSLNVVEAAIEVDRFNLLDPKQQDGYLIHEDFVTGTSIKETIPEMLERVTSSKHHFKARSYNK